MIVLAGLVYKDKLLCYPMCLRMCHPLLPCIIVPFWCSLSQGLVCQSQVAQIWVQCRACNGCIVNNTYPVLNLLQKKVLELLQEGDRGLRWRLLREYVVGLVCGWMDGQQNHTTAQNWSASGLNCVVKCQRGHIVPQKYGHIQWATEYGVLDPY